MGFEKTTFVVTTTDRTTRLPSAGRRRRRTRIVLVACGLVVAGFATATIRLFAWPSQAAPHRVDAIVMFNGPGDRLTEALTLAWAHVAPNLVVSRGSQYWVKDNRCAPNIPGVNVTCFDPSPSTTRGEAEFAAGLANLYHWHDVILVTTRPQGTRARLRMERCFGGHLYLATARLSKSQWPLAIAHEWGATFKAAFLQTSC
jgi:uncharacterized SAM-binding protein YcdF (DUF218 family)